MLSLKGLNTFYGRAHVLHDVDLEIAEGDVVALLGRNGAGKSTLLKSIIGIVPRRLGQITYAGRQIESLAPFKIARLGIGYVPEERRIFSNLTVAENLQVARGQGDGAGVWPLDRLFEVFPNLKPILHRSAARMSGGEQQMLTLARTLMSNPKIMLIDEPSEGLAPIIVERMADMIRALAAQGMTMLISEQNMKFASGVCSRAYVIEKGHIRFDGSIATILQDDALRSRYLAV